MNKTIRRIHAWLGVLFAPSILLFALSGALQMYGCHEGDDGDSPPSWIVRIAQIHMHQTPQLPRARGPRPAAPPEARDASEKPAEARPAEARPARPTTGPLKAFFLLMTIGLITSSFGGLYIAFTSKRDRRLHVGLLVAGIVLPIVLMMM